MSSIPSLTLYGPTDPSKRAALVSFSVDGVHASDIATFLDLEGVCVRAGHHCTQPLHDALGVSHTCRASCYFYTTKEDVDVFVEKLQTTIDFFLSAGKDGGEDGEVDYFA